MMEPNASLKYLLKIILFTLVIFSCIRGGHTREKNTQLRDMWGTIDFKNIVNIFRLTPNVTLAQLPRWANSSTTIIISLDFNGLNATLDFAIYTLTQVALQNNRYPVKWEMWLCIIPRADISIDLDFAINVAKSTNRISNGTITTILIDYGMLQLTPISSPVVKDDLAVCGRKASSSNFRCGIVIDSINCVMSLGHLPQLGLKPGNIFVVGEEYLTSKSNVMLHHTMFLCFWSVKDLNVLIGLKKNFVFTQPKDENSESLIEASANVTNNRKKRSNLNEGENYMDIDYAIFDDVSALTVSRTRNQFNPLRNEGEWLSKPAEFDKNLFGISVYTRSTFVFEGPSVVTALFQQFRRIIIEIDDIQRGTDFIKNITGMAKFSPDFTPKFGLIMNILYDDFVMNKQHLDNCLSMAAVGNKVLPGSVNLILLNWAVPLRQVDSTKKMNVSRLAVDGYLDQAKAMHQILEHARAKNIPNVHFGMLWEVGVLEAIFTSGKAMELVEYIKLSSHYENTILYKVTLSVDSFSWDNLLYRSRTLIYRLTAHIDQLRGPPGSLLLSKTVGVYIGIEGCSRSPSNVSDITEYLLFWEIIQTWAVTKNVTVIINTAYETEQMNATADDCEWEYFSTGRSSCMCGWWHVSKSKMSTEVGNGERMVEDKKSMARRLYVQTKGTKSHQTTKDTVGQNRHPMTYVTLVAVSVLIFCALLGSLTFYLVRHYHSKDLISQREVQNFLLGTKQCTTEELDNGGSISAHDRGYNKERYEIFPSFFTIDFDSHLGQGEFGIVYKGLIKRGDASIDVAVKMKSGRLSEGTERHRNVLALRGIISEIKILSYLGDHPNIVRLEGAYTAKLRRGNIIAFLELCPMGSLDKHLRTYNLETETRNLTEGDVETGLVVSGNVTQDNCEIRKNDELILPMELSRDLVKWSQEIACGMEYLTEMKLVHADLATRNVLLDATGTAKISDFGLSRRLYNYSEYIKQEEASLPWRWMAPESLRKLFFNEKTDVWAFGVTLWEMYTLGDLPYSGLSYHINFPALLTTPTVIGGVRLPKPKFSSDRMYQVMQRCWEIYPGERPTFTELLTVLGGEN